MHIRLIFQRIWCVLAATALSAAMCSAAEPLKLTLAGAVQMALSATGQARLQLAAEAERVADAQLQQVRSAKAFHVETAISDRVLRFDLRSIGVDLPEISPYVANVSLPTIVGPFSVLDTEVRVTKSVINRSANRQIEAARESVDSVKMQSKTISAEIAAQTARAYLEALRAKSEADLAAENIKLSEAGVSVAAERNNLGIVTGTEVRRTNLDLGGAREALFAAQTAYRSAVLRLAASLAVPFDTPIELVDEPVYRADSVRLEDAIQTAFHSRSELVAGDLEIESLRLKEQAIASQARPTLAVFADAGLLTVAPTPNGNTAVVASATYTAGFEFRVPIRDGGYHAGQLAEIESQIRQATIRQQAARRQIELEVRLAFESLEGAAREVELAQQKSSLAETDFDETRARHDAGEASGVELAEAQARTFRSRHDYLSAVYQHQAARVSLAEATGDIVGMNW